MKERSIDSQFEEPFGLLSVCKPRGKTSFEVVGMLRKVLKIKKVGHSGTLDPIASGVLLLCVGRATRLIDYLADLPKTYVAWVKLGVATDTLDCTGRVISVKEVPEFEPAEVEEVLEQFRGEITQVTPAFSAVKRNGKKLYVLARRGVEVDAPCRDVCIFDLELLSLSRSTMKLSIHCSKGTYIRSLCGDIGEKLGCGAHIFRLQRTSIGRWNVDDATPYSRIFSLSRREVADMLEPIEDILSDVPHGEVSPLAEHFAVNGAPVDIDQIRCEQEVNVGDPMILRTWKGKLIGVFRAEEPSQEDLERRPSLPFVMRPEKVLLTTTPPKPYPPPSRRRPPFRKGRPPRGGRRGSYRRPRSDSRRPDGRPNRRRPQF